MVLIGNTLGLHPRVRGSIPLISTKVLRGAIAQMGERLVRNEQASGSIPLSSTKFWATKIMRSGRFPEEEECSVRL